MDWKILEDTTTVLSTVSAKKIQMVLLLVGKRQYVLLLLMVLLLVGKRQYFGETRGRRHTHVFVTESSA